MKLKIIKILVLLLPILGLGQTKTIEGKLIAIGDGDTFTLLSQNKTQYIIRLNGIDCPEKGQDFSKKATTFTYQFCAKQLVQAHILNTDKYGRYIANVFVNGASLNEALIAQGLAWHYTKYSNNQTLAKLELEARSKRLNIWSLNNPMAPWLFRKRGTLELLAPIQPGNVYICKSNSSKTYHNKMCQGLSKCSKGTRQISLQEAIRMGKRSCGYCY
ncbi:MAG: thermonuclease family protein [Bacteroidia bacterium]|nr:thermonuclease family protein [Bacteroidia bacterium]